MQEQRHVDSVLEAAFKRMVVSMLKEEDMEKLFLLLEEGGEDVKEVEQEVLRRIKRSDEEQCLRVLHLTVGREEESFKHLEEKALEVMTRSYSFFSETLWTDFAVKQLSLAAFTKLARAAKKAKLDWDKSDYSGHDCLSDSESESSECDSGQLSDPSMQEDFKALLVWVEREDVEKARRDLVLAVFKTKERSSKGLVLQWMKRKIAGWERKEREEEEEMARIEEELRKDEAMGIPFSFDIPGAYGRRMDARYVITCVW